MARTSLQAAKTELVGLLENARATFGEAHVFDHQPPIANMHDGKAVCVFTAALTPTEYRLAVRILVAGTFDAGEAQNLLDQWMPAVEDALTAHYGPIDFVVEFATDDAPYYSATTVLEVGREDF